MKYIVEWFLEINVEFSFGSHPFIFIIVIIL